MASETFLLKMAQAKVKDLALTVVLMPGQVCNCLIGYGVRMFGYPGKGRDELLTFGVYPEKQLNN